MTELRGLYPASSPFKTGYIHVGSSDSPHAIYYEVHGNPHGAPALFLHGGPGAGCYSNHARFFDPQHWMVVLLDQRGCGRSTPRGCLKDNTTSDLVSDLEALRDHLGVCRWSAVLGGSWGVALSLAYAQAHPSRLLSLVLRGACLMRPQEVLWVFAPAAAGGGAAAMLPAEHAAFCSALPERERGNPLLGYYMRLMSSDPKVQEAAARAWQSWEMSVFSYGSRGKRQQQQQPAAATDVHRWSAGAWTTHPQVPFAPPAGPPPARRARLGGASATAPARAPRRGAVLPAEVLAEPSGDLLPAAALGAPAPLRPAAALGAAAAAPPRAWEWGLPTQGANLWDPEVRRALWDGLVHRGGAGGAAQALLTAHYSVHGAFLLEVPLLDPGLMAPLRDGVRCVVVQGGSDLVCPPATAYDLHGAWPEAEVAIVEGAGHSMYDPAITHELVAATDRMRTLN